MSEVTQDDKTMGMIAHLSAIVLIGPLAIWLMNKDDPAKAFVTEHAKEILNFQITAFAVMIPLDIVLMILWHIPFIGWLAAWLLSLVTLVIGLAMLALVIVAAMKANQGLTYQYPVSLRLIK